MASEFHQRALREQAAAFRAAVIKSGPDAEVPTCPDWNVLKLLQHLSQAYGRAILSLSLGPDDERPGPPRPPADFDDALTWWDEQLTVLSEALATADPERPVWGWFLGGATPRTWARRMAHETAIHRLDAEYALASLGTDHVHDLIFDPELAADGIDEVLTALLPLRRDLHEHEGTVLYHAPDAGRVWSVEYRPGQAPVTGAPADAALEVDATVAGTADALYRKVWGRPSTAVVTGDTTLANLISGF